MKGKNIERLVAMTNFDNEEAVYRFQLIWRRLGIEKALKEKGIQEGQSVKSETWSSITKSSKGKRGLKSRFCLYAQRVDSMDRVKMAEVKRVVVKVGTSTITYPNGKINYEKIEKLARIMTDSRTRGKK